MELSELINGSMCRLTNVEIDEVVLQQMHLMGSFEARKVAF